ncbi:MAG: DUF4838 domain-containing protein [Lentisphaeria bacterium]
MKIFAVLTVLFLTSVYAAENLHHPALNPVQIEYLTGLPEAKLFEDGQAFAVIVVADGPDDFNLPQMVSVPGAPGYRELTAMTAAAQELQRNLKAVSGGLDFPILKASGTLPEDKTLILVGAGVATRKFKLSNEDVAPGGFKVESFSRGIAILGASRPKIPAVSWDGAYGTNYGVFDFLERFAGCRFFFPGPDGTVTPPLNKLAIPPIRYRDAPFYSFRSMHFHGGSFPGGSIIDTMRMALAYRAGGQGDASVRSPVHTPSDPVALGMPCSIDANGEPRKTTPRMPCLGNPDSPAKFIEIAMAAKDGRIPVKEYDIYGAIPTEKYFWFCPPDHPVRCACQYCRPKSGALYHAEASDIFAKFIQKSAELLAEKNPETTLFFLPYYNYTACPPGLRLPGNTKAMVCLMYGESLYHDPEIGRRHREFIDGWYQATGKPVRVYTYPNWPGISYSPFPRQYYHNLQRFTRDFRGRIDGLYSDGPHVGGIMAIEGGFYAFTLPSTYCHFRLMWNPDYDVDAAVRDLCDKLYGAASTPMHNIITRIADLWEGPSTTGIATALELGDYRAGVISKEVGYRDIIRPEFTQMLKTELDSAYQTVPENTVEYRRVKLFGDTLKLFFADYDYFYNPKPSSSPPVKAVRIPGEKPTLSEKLAAMDWEQIPRYYFVNAYVAHSSEPPQKASLQLAWDDKGLLFKVECDEPEPEKIDLQERTNIFSGDLLEFFIEYTAGTTYQMGLNLAGSQKDRFIGTPPQKRAGAHQRLLERTPAGWRCVWYCSWTLLDNEQPFTAERQVRINIVRTRKLKGDYKKDISRLNTTRSRAHADPTALVEINFVTDSKLQTKEN